MARHRLLYNWEDGPLDPEEMQGYWEDSQCYHDEYTETDGKKICDDCEEVLDK